MLYEIKIRGVEDECEWTHARNVYWEEIDKVMDEARCMWNPEGYHVWYVVQDSGYQNPYANIGNDDDA